MIQHVQCYIPGYPRPQFVRKDWQDLCGEWSFAFGEEVTKEQALRGDLPGTIVVPFSCETKCSGVFDEAPHMRVWYARTIDSKPGKRALLHFEGADYTTEVYVNGKYVGRHDGAYSRFTFDITEQLKKGKNLLVVCCIDENHPMQMRGKQRWMQESYGCWYIQTTGIYKAVWMEYVSEIYLKSCKITPCLDDDTVSFEYTLNAPAADAELKFSISFRGEFVCMAACSASEATGTVRVGLKSSARTYQTERWSISYPNLYDVEITLLRQGKVCDRVGSYFGLRSYEATQGKLLLNGEPSFAKLVLAQGYWPESGLTPPSEEALRKDIELAKSMGFNGMRVHQKTESEQLYYYADVMGFLLWCEMPSNYWWSDESCERVTTEWLSVVRQYYNHPSLGAWVLFNENWGVPGIRVNKSQQSLASGMYYLTKSIDAMRPVISDDGWLHTVSDILTLHHYEQDGRRLYERYDSEKKLTEGTYAQALPYASDYQYCGQPIVFSEFGGISYTLQKRDIWGYGNPAEDSSEFLRRFEDLISAVVRMGVAGYCYTQLYDVEQEVNGLLTADRQPKTALQKVKDIVEKYVP